MPADANPSKLQDEFDSYLSAVFGEGKIRENHPDTDLSYAFLRKAFFAGCLVAYTIEHDFWPELERWRQAIRMNASFLTPTQEVKR